MNDFYEWEGEPQIETEEYVHLNKGCHWALVKWLLVFISIIGGIIGFCYLVLRLGV